MALVRFKRTNGLEVWINPAHVIWAEATPYIAESTRLWLSDSAYAAIDVEERVEAVADKLAGRSAYPNVSANPYDAGRRQR